MQDKERDEAEKKSVRVTQSGHLAIMPASHEPIVKGIAACTAATCTRIWRKLLTIFNVYSYLGDVEFAPESEGTYSSHRR